MSGEQTRQVIEAGPSRPEAPEPPPLWWRLRERLKDRPDSEHEQILVRVGIGVAIVAGLVIAAAGAAPPPRVLPLLSIATC